MARANSEAATSVSEIGRAKMAAVERGEKLSELEERTAQMALAAHDYAANSTALANKYRDRKWYQFWPMQRNWGGGGGCQLGHSLEQLADRIGHVLYSIQVL